MDKLSYLIEYLLSERSDYKNIILPERPEDRFKLFRSLVNIRMPKPVSEDYLKVEDEYLRNRSAVNGVTDAETLGTVRDNICLWQGDITTLKCGAIVNAANSGMLGCFCPCHGCIDNAIHTFAGVRLRLKCAEIMRAQSHEEETGGAKITPAFNLPCEYILHTVGPIVDGTLTEKHEHLLASCYRSCLELAEQNRIKSVAFCCISTGEFHFSNERAAEIAVQTVTDFIQQKRSKIRVIFNVFKNQDYELYKRILEKNRTA